jgi:hypothetical protein
MEMKARLGEVTRKYFGNLETSTSATKSYRIPITECKSLIELDDGEVVNEEEYKEMLETLSCLVELVGTIKKHL